jgi:hypothetical protein
MKAKLTCALGWSIGWKGGLVLSAMMSLWTGSANAVTTLATDNGTTIGQDNPNYPGYSAFWRAGFDYSVLTEGTNTYINAPSSSGAIYFRAGNYGHCDQECPGGYPSNAWIDNNGLSVGGTMRVGGGTSQIFGSLIAYGYDAGSTAPIYGSSITSVPGVVGVSVGDGVQGTVNYGNASSAGVRGTIYPAGAGYAIYGDNSSSSGWAGYFNGKVFAQSGYSLRCSLEERYPQQFIWTRPAAQVTPRHLQMERGC